MRSKKPLKFRSDGSWPRQSILNIEFMTNNELKELLKGDVDLNQRSKSGYGGTPLHLTESQKKIRLLLNAGANPHIRDRCGYKPLHLAKSPNKTKLLLKAGANPNSRDFGFHTSLHIAKNPEQIKLLLEYGADLNIKNCLGETPLHSSKNIEKTRILLEYGADPNSKTYNNKTPLFTYVYYYIFYNQINYIDNENFYNTIELLIKKGTKVTQDLITFYLDLRDKKKTEHLLKCMLMKKINWMNAIVSFQNLYRNRLMNPDHPFCKRKLEEDFADFEKQCL